MFSYFKLVN